MDIAILGQCMLCLGLALVLVLVYLVYYFIIILEVAFRSCILCLLFTLRTFVTHF